MKKIFSFIFGIIDYLIVKIAGWKHIPDSKTNFMYLNPHIYKGHEIALRDGSIIKKGDFIAEIHIDNRNVKILDTSYINLIRLLRGELLALKKCNDQEPYSEIKAVYGISVFYNIAERQGFTIIEIRNRIIKFFGSIWENILRLSIKKNGKKTRKILISSKECWISKNQIMNLKG